jgi:hypothetical protein
MVSKLFREKCLPRKDQQGTYHIDGSLVVGDKPAVKSLVQQLGPLLKQLGSCMKIFLTPLACYWVGPCFADSEHHTKLYTPGYLLTLSDAVHALRDNIRDSLYTL